MFVYLNIISFFLDSFVQVLPPTRRPRDGKGRPRLNQSSSRTGTRTALFEDRTSKKGRLLEPCVQLTVNNFEHIKDPRTSIW